MKICRGIREKERTQEISRIKKMQEDLKKLEHKPKISQHKN